MVSEVWLIEGPPGLAEKIAAPPPAATVPKETEKEIYLHLKAMDPVGRRVDPGERYLPEDRFYVDFATDDPFQAAEQYGLAVRAAQQATPNPYTFPTICSWYAGVTFEPDGPKSSRKEPLRHRHHQRDKSRKWISFGRRVFSITRRSRCAWCPTTTRPTIRRAGGTTNTGKNKGFTRRLMKPRKNGGRRFRNAADWPSPIFSPIASRPISARSMPISCCRAAVRWITRSRKCNATCSGVYAAMRGNIAGMMFDYCDELWCFNLAQGGFFDDRVTAASVYRRVFQLAKEGLGPRSWIHERPIDNPGSDMAVGLIDSQRTSGDTASISPKLIARSGLRWYKNRVLFAYDMDSKSLLNAWKETAPNVPDQDGRRMTLDDVLRRGQPAAAGQFVSRFAARSDRAIWSEPCPIIRSRKAPGRWTPSLPTGRRASTTFPSAPTGISLRC